MPMYTDADGRTFSLDALSPEERAYFEKALQAYRANVSFGEFCQITQSARNPAAEGGRMTARSFQNPLMIAILDLEGRLGVRQGKLLRTPSEDVESDPIDRAPAVAGGAAVAAG